MSAIPTIRNSLPESRGRGRPMTPRRRRKRNIGSPSWNKLAGYNGRREPFRIRSAGTSHEEGRRSRPAQRSDTHTEVFDPSGVQKRRRSLRCRRRFPIRQEGGDIRWQNGNHYNTDKKKLKGPRPASGSHLTQCRQGTPTTLSNLMQSISHDSSDKGVVPARDVNRKLMGGRAQLGARLEEPKRE